MPNRYPLWTPTDGQLVAQTTTLDGAGPAIDDATTVTAAGAFGRWVFGSLNIAPTAVNAARIDCKVETGIATGVYSTVQECGQTAGAVIVQQEGFGFFVPTGRRYKFARLALAGTTETFNRYSFSEI